jgi:hypothetical protein
MTSLDNKQDNVKQESEQESELSCVALPTVEHALAYARRGIHVLPLKGKVPLVDGGYKAATTNEENIRGWWDQWPDANIGLATGVTSGILVVDVDPRNRGIESFKKLRPLLVASSNNNLGCPVVMTGGGGFHVYYECVLPIRSRKFKDYKGIDILAEKRYVVAPPSIHPDTGTRYEWPEGRSLDDMPLAPIPGGLMPLITGDDACASPSDHNHPTPTPSMVFRISSAAKGLDPTLGISVMIRSCRNGRCLR